MASAPRSNEVDPAGSGTEAGTGSAAAPQTRPASRVRTPIRRLDEGKAGPLQTCAPAAYSNAELTDMVQVGGVYTPPDLRGRGYAGAVVAGSLLEWRAGRAASGGPRQAILFTGEDNLPAQRAYQSLGFEPIGTCGVVLFG